MWRWSRTVAHIHHVTVVRDLGTTVEVSAGVKDGDQVILNPPVVAFVRAGGKRPLMRPNVKRGVEDKEGDAS